MGQAADLPQEFKNSPFIGGWDLTTPEGQAGWLSVTINEGHPPAFGPSGPAAPSIDYYYFDSELLWAGSHVNPTAWTYLDGSELVVYRTRNVPRWDENGKATRTQTSVEKFTFRVNGNKLTGIIEGPDKTYTTVTRKEFTGTRIPELPPAPDLSKIRLGDPVMLFSSQSLDGWKLDNPEHTNGWRVESGMLVNEVVRGGGTFISYGNLMSEEEYGDVNITMEVKLPEKGNSGIFLRGMYEIQLEDSYNDELSNLGMGALYNRIVPAVKAELPAGEWQTLDITLVDRHLTVILNGTTIIDNQPVPGCTTGAIRSDQTQPGPIAIQGENTSVSFRNIILRPVIH